MTRIFAALFALAVSATAALCQVPGNFAAGGVYGNSSAAARPGRVELWTAMQDRNLCSTANATQYRNSTVWTCLLSANNGIWTTGTTGIPAILAGSGVTGNHLQSNAAGAPSWTTATYPATTTINQLLYSSSANVVAGLATANSSILVTSGGGVPSLSTTLPAHTLGGTVSGGGNQINNVVIGASTPLAGSFTTINGNTFTTGTYTLTGAAGKTLNFSNSITLAGTDGTTWTGPSTNATLAALNIASQTISGGAIVTTLAQSTGNLTVNCGDRPLQSITNGGAFTITAPANDGSCILKVTNNASAGAITFTGFSVGANTGDPLTTTNGNIFFVQVFRVGGTSRYIISAAQ